MTAEPISAEVRRNLASPPERVFAAFADADMVSRWLSPSPDIRLTVMQFDFRTGGTYRFAYHIPNADTVVIGGAYRVIEPNARIIFSWVIEPPDEHAGIESEVTVTIMPVGKGSELVIRHEKLGPADAVARHAAGWRGALDQLTRLLEGKGGLHERRA